MIGGTELPPGARTPEERLRMRFWRGQKLEYFALSQRRETRRSPGFIARSPFEFATAAIR